uniref:Uncharacterized protein n=1 Tax=Parascaris univalens TaxID=6257 RepID=A0A915BV50_PARUN
VYVIVSDGWAVFTLSPLKTIFSKTISNVYFNKVIATYLSQLCPLSVVPFSLHFSTGVFWAGLYLPILECYEIHYRYVNDMKEIHSASLALLNIRPRNEQEE